MKRRRPQKLKPKPADDRMAIVRDHDLLDMIMALDDAADDVGHDVGLTLRRASEYLRDHRARHR
jgi:hypothetical protein